MIPQQAARSQGSPIPLKQEVCCDVTPYSITPMPSVPRITLSHLPSISLQQLTKRLEYPAQVKPPLHTTAEPPESPSTPQPARAWSWRWNQGMEWNTQWNICLIRHQGSTPAPAALGFKCSQPYEDAPPTLPMLCHSNLPDESFRAAEIYRVFLYISLQIYTLRSCIFHSHQYKAGIRQLQTLSQLSKLHSSQWILCY